MPAVRLVASSMLGAAASDILLATFDAVKETTHQWKQQNDPVMGGQSTGTFSVANNLGVFDGECVNVPSLGAPGFIKVSVTDKALGRIFPDISSCDAIAITAKSSTDYKGFRMTIGNDKAPGGKFFAYGYKANFQPTVGEFTTVSMPLTDFTDFWDDATGEAIKTCQENKIYCPSVKTLQDMRTMSVWAEGVAGKVHLEIKSIVATGCKSSEVSAGVSSEAELKLATFDGTATTTAKWKVTNDPVMGGGSSSTFKVTEDKTGLFNGTCRIVDKLSAPGFANVHGSATFADFTGYDNVALRVKSSTPDYDGFKFAFAAPGVPKTSIFGGGSYKAGFKLTGSDWQVVEVPLTEFSYDWSGFTGRCDTQDPASTFKKGQQHYCCSKSDGQPSKPEVCAEEKFFSIVNGIEVWAEGVEGDFNIEIDWIGATKKTLGGSIAV